MQRKEVHVLGVPLDHGAGRRGVNMGPSSIRLAGLHPALRRLGYTVKDHGDVHVPAPEIVDPGEPKARFLGPIAAACAEVAQGVQAALQADGFPLVIGGDHSIAVGTISGIAAHLRTRELEEEQPPRAGVIWFDAHGDINTPETSPSGNVHGMPVACLLGNGPPELTDLCFPGPKIEPAAFCMVGLRDLDPHEKDALRSSGIRTYTMADIDRRGIAAVIDEALVHACVGTDHLHVSFDIDALDPGHAPGTGTRKKGGLTYREAHLACEMIAESGRLRSLEMVEVNPTLDVGNQTSELAVELIASALGSRIL